MASRWHIGGHVCSATRAALTLEVGCTLTSTSAEKKVHTLSQLGRSLKRTLEKVTEGKTMWFRAEIAKISQSPAGHMYLELVEEENGQRLAAMRGTLWSSQAANIRQKLGADADRILSSGTEIVFCGSVL